MAPAEDVNEQSMLKISGGHPLYHGTGKSFDESAAPLLPGAWIGYPLSESLTYASQAKTEERRLIRYVAAHDLELVSISSGVNLEGQLAQAAACGHDGIVLDMRDPANGTHALFLVLADPAHALDYVETRHIGPMLAWECTEEDVARYEARQDNARAMGADDPELAPAGIMSLDISSPAGPRM
jgi:hypothetical protein